MKSHKTPLLRIKELERKLQRKKLLKLIPQKRLKDYENPLERYDGLEFKQRYHIFKETAVYVVQIIQSDLSSAVKRGVYVPPIVQFCLAERYYVTGSMQLVIADLVNVSQPTVSNIISRVSKAIAKHCENYIKYPDYSEATAIRKGFYELGGFPGVVGCIDCTHVQIVSPGGKDAELFRNRKQVFSINVQAICDHELNFTNLVAKWHGSAHDSRIFSSTFISVDLETGKAPPLLLGDSGYPLLPYLMVPLSNPTTTPELRYNKAQLTTRNSIERAFGVLKRRFPCLLYCRLKVNTVLAVIVATAVLHNISRKRSDIFEADSCSSSQGSESRQHTCFIADSTSGKVRQKEIIQTHFS